MQMLNQENKRVNIKKSQLCLFGSLLVIFGGLILSNNYINELKKQVFSEMQLSLINSDDGSDIIIEDIPEVEEVKTQVEEQKPKEIDYSVYNGVLEIPKISLKRGFYHVDHKYNDIEHNVTVIRGSNMPDVAKGNLILAAHSGDAYVSYFAYLYKLQIGDLAYVTYNGNKYKYQIVNIYNVPKIGTVTINRNLDRTVMTLITCTKDSDTEQTVYILEMI